MRIAFAVSEFPLLSETFVLNQITGLLDLGHEVEVQTIHRGDFSLLGERAAELTRLTRSGRMPWTWLVRLIRARQPLREGGPHRIDLLKSLNPLKFGKNALSLRLLYAIPPYLGRSYDVVQCHFGPNGNLAAQIKALGLTDARLVTMFHGYDLREAHRRGGRVWHHLRRYGDVFLAISDYSRRRLVELGFDEDRIEKHPVGIDPSCFRFRWSTADVEVGSTGRIRILSVGRLVPEKGHEFGVRAIHELLRRRPSLDVEYTIIGNGPTRNRVWDLATRLGLEDVVRLPGAAGRREVAAAMEGSDLFLLPSVAEVLPMVLMEAQATGLPIVATDVGATSEIVEEGCSGYLAPARDPGALADRLEHLIEHPGVHRPMGRRGRAIVEERYDIRKLNKDLVRIYESA